jgi:hypothetical protein
MQSFANNFNSLKISLLVPSCVSLFVSVLVPSANALPLLDKAANTGDAAVKVYPDRDEPNKYWYIPVSVEPWTRDNNFKSQLYSTPNVLTFIFRGQASVDDTTLSDVAKSLGVPKANLSPIAYDKTQNLVCQNVFVGEKIQWLWPPKIGGYLEVVPISLRTNDPKLVPELKDLITGGGLGCTVDLTFRAVTTAYAIKVTANLDSVYERLQVAAHAEGLWWEVDLNTTLEKLQKEGVIKVEKLQDANAPNTPLDDMIRAATDDLLKRIVSEMFTPSLKLPTGEIVGRGKPWSLRVDYRKSEEHKRWTIDLKSEQIVYKDSTIGIRMALGQNLKALDISQKPIKVPAGMKSNAGHKKAGPTPKKPS